MGVAVSQKKWLVRSRRTHDHWQNKVWNIFLMLHLSVDLISYPIQLIDVDRICYGQVTWEQWLMVIPPSWMGFLLMGILIASIGLMTISLCAYVNQLLTMAHVCWFLLHPWTSSIHLPRTQQLVGCCLPTWLTNWATSRMGLKKWYRYFVTPVNIRDHHLVSLEIYPCIRPWYMVFDQRQTGGNCFRLLVCPPGAVIQLGCWSHSENTNSGFRSHGGTLESSQISPFWYWNLPSGKPT